MKPLALASASLIALHAQSGVAQPTAVQPTIVPAAPVPPVPSSDPSSHREPSGHMIDRFVAGLPKKVWWPMMPSEPDREELKALGRLNPGRDAQIAAILRASEACAHAARELRSLLVLRESARRIGVAKLGRLIDLFAGPDFEAFDAVADRIAKSPAPTPADIAERDKLLAAYPIEEFSREVVTGMEAAFTDEDHLAALHKCSKEKTAAMARVGIKSS